jgi:hypothetical protein
MPPLQKYLHVDAVCRFYMKHVFRSNYQINGYYIVSADMQDLVETLLNTAHGISSCFSVHTRFYFSVRAGTRTPWLNRPMC